MKTSIKASILLAVVILAISVFYYFIGRNSGVFQNIPAFDQDSVLLDNSRKEVLGENFQAKTIDDWGILSVRSSFDSNDTEGANRKIAYLLEKEDLTLKSRQYLLYMGLPISLSTNLTLKDKITVIEKLKAIALDKDYEPQLRAFAINDLATLYFRDFDETIFNQIFKGGFEKYISVGDKSMSIRNLSEFSYSLYPTTSALLAINYWYNVSVLDNPELSSKDKEEHISFLIENLKKLEKQLYFEFKPDDMLTKSSYLGLIHRKAFVEGLIALKSDDEKIREEYSEKFQKDYELVLESYEKNSKNGPSRLITTIPYTYFNYASFLNEYYGKKQQVKVNELLSRLTVLLKEKKAETINFNNFIKQQFEKPVAERDHNYYFLIDLIKINPEFAKLVEEIKLDL